MKPGEEWHGKRLATDVLTFLSPACEDPPAVLLEVQGTIQRPLGRDSRISPANCTWLILGSKEQTVTIR